MHSLWDFSCNCNSCCFTDNSCDYFTDNHFVKLKKKGFLFCVLWGIMCSPSIHTLKDLLTFKYLTREYFPLFIQIDDGAAVGYHVESSLSRSVAKPLSVNFIVCVYWCVVNGTYIFNVHWPNSLRLIEGFFSARCVNNHG